MTTRLDRTQNTLTSVIGRLAGLLAAGLLVLGAPLPAAAVEIDVPCMENECGSQNCTANDVNLVLVGLGIQDDGCIDANDSVSMWLRAIGNTTTGQTRYDISMWFATDGDPNGDGARTGTCAVEILVPAASVEAQAPTCYDPSTNPGGVDLSCGGGPFLNSDGDACGDITKGGDLPDCGRQDDITNPNDGNDCTLTDGIGDETILDFVEVITFPCTDTYDAAASPPDGFVDLPYCITWHNQSSSTDCDFPNTPICPSQKSKCTCETGLGAATNVPSPALDVSCTCPATVNPGDPADCTVTYSNPGPAGCIPDPNTLERYRCGTASFVYFEVDYDETNGSITASSTSGTGGGGTVSDDSSLLSWSPASSASTPNIIGPGDTATLSYTYTPNPSVSGTLTFPVSTYWSDAPGLSPAILQTSLSPTCTLELSPTWAAVSRLSASPAARGVVVEWETAVEAATVGFHLERLDGDDWRRVNERPVPGTRQLPGGFYRVLDEEAPPLDRLHYRVVEVEAFGGARTWGPFEVEVDRSREVADFIVPYEVIPRAPSRRILEQQAKAAAAVPMAGPTTSQSDGRGKILVRETGLYELAAAEVAAAVGVQERKARSLVRNGQLRLSHRGAEIAWLPVEDGTALRFFGEAPTGLFDTDNVYWIEQGRGRLMEIAQGAGPEPVDSDRWFFDTVHVERDLFPLVAVATDPAGDYWLWDGLLAGDPTYGSAIFALELEGVAATAGEVEIVVELWALAGEPTSPAHRAELYLNGSLIGETSWDGRGTRSVSFTTGQSLLADGANTIEVVALAGNFFVDSFDIGYRRRYSADDDAVTVEGGAHEVVTVAGFGTPDIEVYELADSRLPIRLDAVTVDSPQAGEHRVSFRPSTEDSRYLTIGAGAVRADAIVMPDFPSNLRSSSNRGEYLVIAPRSLVEAASALADYRRSRGMVTRVAIVDDIMDEFNHGLSSPEALRDFVAHAWQSWQIPPSYLVLAGKGSFDYRDLLGLGGNLVPPLMGSTPVGLSPVDGRYGDVSGDDGIPDIAVGRIPVLSEDELLGYVDKLAAWEGAGGTMPGPIMLVADDPDVAGNFPDDSDALWLSLPFGTPVEPVYLYRPFQPDEARERIIDGINSGCSLMNYLGHGGLDRLATESMLSTDDVPLLSNREQLTVVTALTCYIARFDYPGSISLGEELVVHDRGGAAAVLGPTGLSANSQAVQLAEHALAALLDPRHERLGDAVLQAMSDFVAGGGDPRLIDVYTLLGDPAAASP